MPGAVDTGDAIRVVYIRRRYLNEEQVRVRYVGLCRSFDDR